jgi:CelD/BcsL family acetyltransferase involved in cellulose biosynthesis
MYALSPVVKTVHVERLSMPSFSTEVIRTDAELAMLETEWNQLFERVACSNVFLSFQWMSQWWRHFGEGNRLFVVVVRDETMRLLGLAPLYISRSLGPLRIHRLGFLTDHMVGSDYLDVLVDQDTAPTVLRFLCACILSHRQEWDYIDLADNLPGSNAANGLRLEFERCGLITNVGSSSTCPYLPLPESLEEHWANLGSKTRKHLRYYLRALQRLGPVEFVTVRNNADIGKAFDDLVRLHGARSSERGIVSTFLSPRVNSFHRAALKSLTEAGKAQIHQLRLRGECIAALYTFSAGARVLFYQSGMHPDFGRFSVGSMLIKYAIDDAVTHRFKEFDFLRGEEPYKYQWATATRRLQCLRMFDKRSKSRLAHVRSAVRTSLHNCRAAVKAAFLPSKASSGRTVRRVTEDSSVQKEFSV